MTMFPGDRQARRLRKYVLFSFLADHCDKLRPRIREDITISSISDRINVARGNGSLKLEKSIE